MPGKEAQGRGDGLGLQPEQAGAKAGGQQVQAVVLAGDRQARRQDRLGPPRLPAQAHAVLQPGARGARAAAGRASTSAPRRRCLAGNRAARGRRR